MDEAKEILDLNKLWQDADSDTILDNVEQLLTANGCETFTDRWKKLVDITDSTKYAVYAWLNRGRKDVKIPFLKLCMISDTYKINIKSLILGGNYMFTKKFAITHTIGNEEKVLKTFEENQRAEAVAYGAEVSKGIYQGVISMVLGEFSESGLMKQNTVRVYEVWEGR